MRIIQVVPSLAAGGLERVATTLTLKLAASGDEVLVATKGATTHRAFERELLAAGIEIALIPRPRPRPDLLLRSAVALARLVRLHRPDVVHAHNPAAGAAAALARLLAGRRDLPIVVTYHGLVDGGEKLAARLLSATADVVVGVGPAATAELVRAGLGEERTATVLNAVEVGPIRPREEVRVDLGVADDAELVVTVGRYRKEKNQALLLEATKLLAPARPRLRAQLVGIGPLEAWLRERVAELGLEGIAVVAGLRDDPLDVAAAADVATLTSNREGLGLTLIEAMAAGTAVVGTAVGGILDVVTDGETGLLVPPGDAPALAAAIARLLDDEPLRRRLEAAARDSVRTRFSVDAMTAGYRDVYELARLRRASTRRTGARSSK